MSNPWGRKYYSGKCSGTKSSKRSDPFRNRTPGGKGINLPPPSSDDESFQSARDDCSGDKNSNVDDEESSSSSEKPKFYYPSFHRVVNEEFCEKRYSP